MPVSDCHPPPSSAVVASPIDAAVSHPLRQVPCPSAAEKQDTDMKLVEIKPLRRYVTNRIFACPHPGCDRKFTHPGSVKRHVKSHDPHRCKSFVCTVEGCDYKFYTAWELRQHGMMHLKVKPFACKECGKGFKRLHCLKEHLVYKHGLGEESSQVMSDLQVESTSSPTSTMIVAIEPKEAPDYLKEKGLWNKPTLIVSKIKDFEVKDKVSEDGNQSDTGGLDQLAQAVELVQAESPIESPTFPLTPPSSSCLADRLPLPEYHSNDSFVTDSCSHPRNPPTYSSVFSRHARWSPYSHTRRPSWDDVLSTTSSSSLDSLSDTESNQCLGSLHYPIPTHRLSISSLVSSDCKKSPLPYSIESLLQEPGHSSIPSGIPSPPPSIPSPTPGAKPKQTYPCPECCQVFTRSDRLKRHRDIHLPHRPRPFVCDEEGCGKAFYAAYHLKQHQAVHMKVKPFQCQFCKRGFAQKSSILLHDKLREKHGTCV